MKLLFLLFITITIISCSLLSTEKEGYISFPTLPASYEDVIEEWRVTLLHEDGREESFCCGVGELGFSFTLEKGEQLICLCQGLGPYGWELKPAGIFLVGQERGTLSFAQGASLQILSLLRAEGVDLREFNGQRLCQEMAERFVLSPWDWDSEEIREDIVMGDFNLYTLKKQTTYSSSLIWEGLWVSEDVNRGVVDSQNLMLTEGQHRFFSPTHGVVRDLYMKEEGEEVFLDYFPLWEGEETTF